jgi:hypothetical protein
MSAELALTSAASVVTMQDLELEHAELLPVRVTLYLWEPNPINPGGPMRGCPPPPVGNYPPPPVGSCPPLPHADASTQPDLVACPM